MSTAVARTSCSAQMTNNIKTETKSRGRTLLFLGFKMFRDISPVTDD